jgi:hypothetical protein
MARIAPARPGRTPQSFAGPQLDSFVVDKRSKTARFSSALDFLALAVPETWDRATTTSHHAVTGSHNFTFSVGAIYDESSL